MASIAGLVAISAKIMSMAEQLYHSAKEAPVSIRRTMEEMQDMSSVFCEVHSFMVGTSKIPSRSKLSMISLDKLVATLTGCVLVCSKLDKTLCEVAGLVDPSPSTSNGKLGPTLERIKWALWREVEATEIIEDLQRHKLSLKLMLSIIHW